MPRPKRYNASQRTSTTIIDDGGSAPANVLLRLRESTSAADLRKLPAPKLDPFGLAPDLSLRVAGFADDFNRAHAEDSLVRSLLLQYSRAAASEMSRYRSPRRSDCVRLWQSLQALLLPTLSKVNAFCSAEDC